MKNWKNIKIQKRTVNELFIGNKIFVYASQQMAVQSMKIIHRRPYGFKSILQQEGILQIL